MNYSEYHPDWKDIIRPSVMQRDNYVCQKCRIRHKSKVYKKSNREYHVCDEFEFEWAKANNKKPFILYLQVAHLDHDKTNNEASNLLTMCPSCHHKFDKAHKLMMRKVYKDKTLRPVFKDDFKITRTYAQVNAYIESRYPWVLKAAPSNSEYKNFIRFIQNNM